MSSFCENVKNSYFSQLQLVDFQSQAQTVKHNLNSSKLYHAICDTLTERNLFSNFENRKKTVSPNLKSAPLLDSLKYALKI